jgi:hypothetical protein
MNHLRLDREKHRHVASAGQQSPECLKNVSGKIIQTVVQTLLEPGERELLVRPRQTFEEKRAGPAPEAQLVGGFAVEDQPARIEARPLGRVPGDHRERDP